MFTVGLADPNSTDYSAIINKNFTLELLSKTKFFHLRGGIDYKKLSPLHKCMMAMMKRTIQRKPEFEREADDKEFLDTYNSKVSFEDERTIVPVIAYVSDL